MICSAFTGDGLPELLLGWNNRILPDSTEKGIVENKPYWQTWDFPPYPEEDNLEEPVKENAEEDNAQDVPALKESVQLDDPEEKIGRRFIGRRQFIG